MPLIRKAKTPDAGQLTKLAEGTFRDTFEAMNTPENMNLHCETHYSEEIQAREILDPEMTTLVCEQQEELIGYAQLRCGEPPPCVHATRPFEILRLYVAKEWHGKGIAQGLMAESIALAEAQGSDQIWLGVWERNPRAISFYKKFGFVEVGDHVFPLGTDPQRDIIMVCPNKLSQPGAQPIVQRGRNLFEPLPPPHRAASVAPVKSNR